VAIGPATLPAGLSPQESRQRRRLELPLGCAARRWPTA